MKKLLIIIFVLIPCSLFAGECTEYFSWLPNTETDLAGYKIYYGRVDGVYPYSADVGIPPTSADGRVRANIFVELLNCGEKGYFVGVAYNEAGLESIYSQVAVVDIIGQPSPPKDFRVEEQ